MKLKGAVQKHGCDKVNYSRLLYFPVKINNFEFRLMTTPARHQPLKTVSTAWASTAFGTVHLFSNLFIILAGTGFLRFWFLRAITSAVPSTYIIRIRAL